MSNTIGQGGQGGQTPPSAADRQDATGRRGDDLARDARENRSGARNETGRQPGKGATPASLTALGGSFARILEEKAQAGAAGQHRASDEDGGGGSGRDGALPQQVMASPATPLAQPAPAGPAPAAHPPASVAARVENIMSVFLPRLEQLVAGPQTQAGIGITIPLDVTQYGLEGLKVNLLGLGPTAPIEVVLVGATGDFSGSIAAAAQQLAERLQARFPRRGTRIVEAAGAAGADERPTVELASRDAGNEAQG